MRAFNTLKWSALPLALSLAGCSLLGGADVKGKPASLLAYISMQSAGQVAVVSLISRTPDGEAIPAGSAPANMVLNPRSDREYLYVVNPPTNTISYLNVRSRQNEVTVKTGLNPWDVAITPDGRYLYVTNTGDGTVSYIDIDNRSNIKNFEFPQIASASVRPRGIVTHPADPTGTVAPKQDAYVISDLNVGTSSQPKGLVVSLNGAKTGTTFEVGGAVRLWKGAVTPDGSTLLVTDLGKNVLWSLNLNSGAAVQIPLHSAAWDVVVSSNREKPAAFVSLKDAGMVQAIDLSSNSVGQPYTVVPAGTSSKSRQPQALALNTQGNELWVALAGSNEVVIFPHLDGPNFTNLSGARLITYSHSPGQTGAPEDIVLGRGVQ